MTTNAHRLPSSSGLRVWGPVLVLSGCRGAIENEASVRVFYENGKMKQIKGNFTLEKWGMHPIRFRLAYDGYRVDRNDEDMAGSIEFPRAAWKVTSQKCKSENMKGRIILIDFNPTDSDEGLKKIQIVIPTPDQNSKVVATTIAEAFHAAMRTLVADIKARPAGRG